MIVDEKMLRTVIKKWGRKPQIGMLYEEMGELMTAINQHERGRLTLSHVHEEIADCLMMLQQMRWLYGKDGVDKWIEIKTKRLQARIDDPERDIL